MAMKLLLALSLAAVMSLAYASTNMKYSETSFCSLKS